MSVSLRTRVVLLIIVIIILLTTSLSILIGVRASEDLKSEIGNKLSNTAFQLTSRLDQYMWGRAGAVRMLSELPELKHMKDQAEIILLLNKTKAIYPAFAWIGITDDQGIVFAGTDGMLVGKSIANRPVYIEGIQKEFIGDVHDAVLLAKLLPNPSGEPMKFVDISLPLKNDDNKTIGAIAAHLSWSWAEELEQSMFNSLQARNKEEIFIVSRIDNSILLGPKNMLGQKLTLDSIKQAQNGDIGWKQELWPDGKEYITGYAAGDGYLDFRGLGWTVLVRQPIEIAYNIVYRLQLFIWLIGGLFSAVFALISWKMAGSITKPLWLCARVADQIRFGGRLEIPAHKGIKEVEILTDSLKELVHSLSTAENERNKMESMAFHDRLTGLPNRTGLENFIMSAPEMAKKENASMAVLCLDLDGFKNVNDSLGHLAGDMVLKEVAQRLKRILREGEFIARLGGDEFIAILFVEEKAKQKIVGEIATRIIQELNKPFNLESGTASIGCSIGCTFWLGKSDIKNAIDLADKALYDVKKSGKNRFFIAEGIAM